MEIIRSAAFLLPDAADVRAVLLALADMDTDCGVYTNLERFTDGLVLWVVVEGADDAQATIDAVMRLMPAFGLTYTEDRPHERQDTDPRGPRAHPAVDRGRARP